MRTAREFARWFLDRPERQSTRADAEDLLTKITEERDRSHASQLRVMREALERIRDLEPPTVFIPCKTIDEHDGVIREMGNVARRALNDAKGTT